MPADRSPGPGLPRHGSSPPCDSNGLSIPGAAARQETRKHRRQRQQSCLRTYPLYFWSCSRIALGIRRRRPRSQRKLRLRSLLLHAAARDSRRSQLCLLELLAHRAWNPPPSSSLAKETTLPLPPPPCGGARFPTLAALSFGAARASRLESAAVVLARKGNYTS